MIKKVCSYIGLTTKYEPNTWEEVIGQKEIIYILKNAIKKCFLSKMLLFVGIKGIGKSTCARILVQELSSSNIVHKFELNGTLTYSINYLNSIIHKIYHNVKEEKFLIIQNINDVSTNFIDIIFPMFHKIPLNMLLIICANKINKIVEYIMSSLSCQIYEFSPISLKENFNHLKNISNKESINIDNETLLYISKYGNGSLMNSMNKLDQLLYFNTFLNKTITKKLVLKKLGILDPICYFKIVDYLLNNNIYDVLILLDNIVKMNISSLLFIQGFIKHLRMLLISKFYYLNLSVQEKNNIKSYIQQSKKISSLCIIDSLKIFCKIEHKLYCLMSQNILYDNKNYYKLIETYILSLFMKYFIKNKSYCNNQYKIQNTNLHDTKFFRYFLEQNWKYFIEKNSKKINPYYFNILKNEIQFYILNNKIFLIKPSIIKDKDLLVIHKSFLEKLQKQCNNQNFEFEILTKQLDNFSVEEYNLLSKKNENMNQLIDRFKLKLKSPSSIPPPITSNSIETKIKDNY
ncbi:hypothetical protein [Blattabacterium cuenoti]|uniref:hypothetical protein n=1 Tax=Blattabacterium cuenoti TaxID=1653831 RepID=UPI001EEA9C60|nr:hypothetical protein [Blattabacterium cuenoti]